MDRSTHAALAESQSGNGLQRLPTELFIHLMSYVNVNDLMAVRATNHRLHHLIHANEEALGKAFDLKYQAIYDCEGLFVRHTGDLLALLTLSRKLKMIQGICAVIADRVASKINFTSVMPEAEAEAFKSRKSRSVQGRLVRATFMLEVFLECFRARVVRSTHQFQPFTDAEYVELSDNQVFSSDQQGAIEGLFAGRETLILEVSAALQLMRGVCRAHGLPTPSPTEKDQSATRYVMTHQGLAPFGDLLVKLQPADHWRKVLDDRSREIWQSNRYPPYTESKGPSCRPLSTIYSLRKPTSILADQWQPISRSRPAQIALLNRQDFWDEAARAVLMRLNAGRKKSAAAVQLGDRWLPDFFAEEGDPAFAIGSWDQLDVPS